MGKDTRHPVVLGVADKACCARAGTEVHTHACTHACTHMVPSMSMHPHREKHVRLTSTENCPRYCSGMGAKRASICYP